MLAAKYGQHLPLTRQSAIYAREGVEIDVSTLADWVGAAAATLMPLVLAIRAHVFAAERLHGDDTTVPVLAKERTRTGRLWGYVRDDRPFGGPAPPAVAFFYSPDRKGEHPERHLAGFAGILQADAYAGFDRLYEPGARAGADPRGRLLGARPQEAVRAGRGRARRRSRPRRCGASTSCSRSSATSPASRPRSAWRSGAERSAPILAELEPWLRAQHERVSRKSEIGKAIAYATQALEGAHPVPRATGGSA